MKLKGPYDLIVCSDVLHYVSTDEMRRGLKTIAGLLGGVAFLELFTRDDETEGDDCRLHCVLGDGRTPRAHRGSRSMIAEKQTITVNVLDHETPEPITASVR